MKEKKPDCVCALSGGIDTTVLVYHLVKDKQKKPYCVYMDYGANFREKELSCIDKTCEKLGLEYQVIDARWYKEIAKCQMFGDDIDQEKGAMHWLEGRNCIITLVLGVIASELGVKDVYMGVHKPAEGGWEAEKYPDALPITYEALNGVFKHGFKKDVSVKIPFAEWDYGKEEIVKMGQRLEVPWEDTTTCCTQNEACWLCEACDDRIKAFDKANIEDTIRDYKMVPKGTSIK